MAFRSANLERLAKFNSAVSSDFLEMYEQLIDEDIISENSGPKHKTFAPSASRCKRISWFRLRGVEPDAVVTPDRVMKFSAEVGTACHRVIQGRLARHLKDNWVDVQKYIIQLESDPGWSFRYETAKDESGYETLVEVVEGPPVRFAVDGIVRINGKLYLLEIKTSDFASFDELTDPKSKHIYQVKVYCTLLDLNDVLFLYQDRQYGGLKCFEFHVTETDKEEIKRDMQYVMDMVDANIAPDGLPKGDPQCSSSMCPYFKKCAQWGR